MRVFSSLLMTFCLVLPCATSAQVSPDQSLDESLRMGTEAIRSGHVADAEKYFTSALRADPENPQALMGLGVADLRLGKPEAASESLKRALDKNPELGGGYLFLGIAYAQMHRVDECIGALKHEVELNPTDAQAYMWMGVVELQDGHPEKATEPLDHAAELAPDDLNILEYRGKAHNDVAFASYARMAVIDPDSWHVHRVQGQIYSRQNQHKEAIAEFQEAIKKMPNNSDLYEELGSEYRKSSQLELSQQAYSKEMELSPNNPVAMYNLAKIDIETNRSEDGLQLLERVVSAYKDFPATYFYLGLGQFDLGKTKEAVVSLEKARGMHPEPELAPRVEYELSRVYRKLGRIEESNKAIHEYTRLKAQNSHLNPEVLSAISAGFGSASVPTTDAKKKN
jgi:tetratricopeptide (TPR) repeat protein